MSNKRYSITVSKEAYDAIQLISIVYSNQISKQVTLGKTVDAVTWNFLGDMIATSGELHDDLRQKLLKCRDALDQGD